MSKQVYKVAVANGQYTDDQGNQKTRWLHVGAIVENDKGNLSLILNAIPAPTQGNDQQAWFMNVFPVDRNRQSTPAQKTQAPALGQSTDYDDDIPF